jgi:hypothetical protein
MAAKDQKRQKTTRMSRKLTVSMPTVKTVHAPAGRAVERDRSFKHMQGERGIKKPRSTQGKNYKHGVT